MADLLDETARQVRLDNRDDSTVHELVRAWTDPHAGRTYKTRCDHVMTRSEGAVLTTRPATCTHCASDGMVRVILAEIRGGR